MSAIPFHRPCPKCAPGKPCGRTRMCVGGREIGANVVHSNEDEIKVWREMVGLQARVSLNAAGLRDRPVYPTGGVTLGVVFWMQRPQGHFTSKGALSAEGERNTTPWHKPDGDKLLRAILDSLTSQVYTDDAQVTGIIPVKRFAVRPRLPGVTVLIEPDSAENGSIVPLAKVIDDITRGSLPATGRLF